jgi:hypothetical protein
MWSPAAALLAVEEPVQQQQQLRSISVTILLASWTGINSLQFLSAGRERSFDHGTWRAHQVSANYYYCDKASVLGSVVLLLFQQFPELWTATRQQYSLVQDLGAEEELGMVGLEHFSLFPVPKSLVVSCQLSKTDMTYLISSRPEAEVVLFRSLV